ncbi:MAG TPA: hypothetical protein VFE23_09575 [Usitatibacter sp.]|jgi:MFS-type transporter involved in bile tolerance (Atg22 family)|nr:hypothetical protein [Usitatibacter sp.]
MAFFFIRTGRFRNAATTGAVVPFIAAALAVGIAQGVASTGGLRALLGEIEPARHVGLLSSIYPISHRAAAIPALVAGRFAATQSLFHIAVDCAVPGTIAAVIAIAPTRGSRP